MKHVNPYKDYGSAKREADIIKLARNTYEACRRIAFSDTAMNAERFAAWARRTAFNAIRGTAPDQSHTLRTLNRRERLMLWKLLEFPLHRYLLSIERSGFERAERHMEFSKLLWEVKECRTALPEHHKEWMKLHDLIAEKVTGDLPKSIGYDFKEEKDWDLLADRLFEKLLNVV